jgi:cytochrome P450
VLSSHSTHPTYTISIAGTETVASTLTAAIYQLDRNPIVRSKLVKELDDAIGVGVLPDYEQVKDLPYLKAVAEEM